APPLAPPFPYTTLFRSSGSAPEFPPIPPSCGHGRAEVQEFRARLPCVFVEYRLAKWPPQQVSYIWAGPPGYAKDSRKYTTEQTRSEEHTSELQSRENLV